MKNNNTEGAASTGINYEKQIFDLKQLLEISKCLNSTLDFNILIDSILYTCMGQMQVVKAAIFIKKALDQPFFSLHRDNKGFELDYSADYSIPEESGLVKYLIGKADCVTMPELIEDIDNVSDIKVFTMLDPSLIIPLIFRDTLSGIIIIGERIDGRAFSDDEKAYLLSIANFASIAIRNAFLFEMTTTDMMTMLKIRHYFSQTLIKMLKETKEKDNNMLSLLMLDIDHFKNLNDSYGHTFGDKVLIGVAGIIRKNIRQFDIAARYGGEEFAVILPNTDIKTACGVGERIRSSIEQMKTIYPKGNIPVPVTISVGAAQFDPGTMNFAEDLVNEADKALYYSKETGRNRISVSGIKSRTQQGTF